MNKIVMIAFAGALSLLSGKGYSQGMSVNTTGAAANASAILDVNSTSQGMLTPRMDSAQRASIATPATGLLVYQTNGLNPGFYYYNGSAWAPVAATAAGSGWSLTGNAGTNSAVNFIGTTDANPLTFKVNNVFSGQMSLGSGSCYFGYLSGGSGSSSGLGGAETAFGAYSLYSDSNGITNAAFGPDALFSNKSGTGNVAVGSSTLLENTTGSDNVAIGVNSLYANTTGTRNIAIGSGALYYNSTATDNIAIGYAAIGGNYPGNDNTAIGYAALQSTTGNNNVALGYIALYNATTGSDNTALGYEALFNATTGSDNTALGYEAGVSTGTLTNTTALGYEASVTVSNKVVIGNSSVTVIGGYASWSNLSDGRFKSQIQENVPGLDFIMKLRPVTYHLEARKFDRFLGKPDSILKKDADAYDLAEGMVRTGFIAQDVEKAAQETDYDFSGLHKPVNDKDNYSLVYAEFTVPMVKAIQEQQKTIEELKRQVAHLIKEVEELQKK